jgi:hypothetical protein
VSGVVSSIFWKFIQVHVSVLFIGDLMIHTQWLWDICWNTSTWHNRRHLWQLRWVILRG